MAAFQGPPGWAGRSRQHYSSLLEKAFMKTPSSLKRRTRRAKSPAILLAALAGLLGTGAASHAQTATVSVSPASSRGTVPFQGFGLGSAVYDNNLNNASLPGLLQSAGITTLRYPGGGYADEYHWSTASSTNNSGYVAGGTDFGHFSQLLQKIGGAAVLTVNYYSNQNGTGLADPYEAAAWVAYANGAPGSSQAVAPGNPNGPWKTVGYWASLRAAAPLSQDDGKNFLRISHSSPLRDQYWEIGNEVFYSGEPYHAPNPTGSANITAYGNAVNNFAKVMKAIDPTIKIGVDLLNDPVDYTQAWNSPLLQICGPSIDFGIAHYYPPHGSDAQLLSEPLGQIPGPGGVAATLRAEYQRYCGANGPNVQTLITETGYTYGTINSPVVDALLSADDYATWLENGVTNIDYNQLTSVLYNDTSPQPSYYGIQMTHYLESPGDVMVTASTNQGLLHAHAARKANGHLAVMLVNTDPSTGYTATLNTSGFALAGSGVRRDYGSGNTVTTGTVSGSGSPSTYTVYVPAYTITVLDIPASTGGGTGGGPVANGTYHLQNRTDGNLLDTLGNTGSGTAVGQYPGSGSTNQQWKLTYSGGYYTIQSSADGLSLDTLGNTGNGTGVGQYSASGSANQQWSLTATDSGYYKIINRATGECLDTGGLTATGSAIQQWASSGSYNQQWSIK